MAIDVHCHHDRGMSEPLLHDLGRQFLPAVDLPVDAPAGIEVAKRVKAVFRTPVCRGDAGGDQRRAKPAMHDVGMVFDVATSGRKDEPFLALGADWRRIHRDGARPLPLTKRVDDDRRQGDRPLARFGLGLADSAVAIGALPDVQLPFLKVDVGPAKTTKLRGSETAEDRGQQDRPPAARSCLHNGLDLLAGGNVYSDLELALLAPLCPSLRPAMPCLAKLANDVARYETTLLRIAQQRR